MEASNGAEPLAQPEPKEVPDRLTVVETVYHQPWGEEPVAVESRFSRDLQTRNQLFERRCRVGEDWQPLECGWLGEAGMLVIENREGRFLQRVPTDEEREAAAAKVLEVGWEPDGATMHDPPATAQWIIPPGESIRGQPATLKSLRLRCRSGECRFTVYLLPE